MEALAYADYYGPHGLFTPERPLVLVGFFGANTRKLARHLACLSGAPLLDIPRLAEHRLGRSLWQAQLRVPEHQALFRDILRGVLAQRPAGVVAVGDATPASTLAQPLGRADADVFHVDVPYEMAQATIDDDNGAAVQQLWADSGITPPHSSIRFRALYDQHRAAYSRLGQHHVDARLSLHRQATQVFEHLQINLSGR